MAEKHTLHKLPYGNQYLAHHEGKRIGTVRGIEIPGEEGGKARHKKFSATLDRKNAKGEHSPVAKHGFSTKEDAHKWVVSQYEKLDETANVIGNAGEGAIDTFDPVLEIGKKKKKDDMARRKPIQEKRKEDAMDDLFDDEDEENTDDEDEPKKKKRRTDESVGLSSTEIGLLIESLALTEAKADRYGKPSLDPEKIVGELSAKAAAKAKRTYTFKGKSEGKGTKVSVKKDKAPPAPQKAPETAPEAAPAVPSPVPAPEGKAVTKAAPKPAAPSKSAPQPVTPLDYINQYWETGSADHHKAAQAAIGMSVAAMKADKFQNPIEIKRHETALTNALRTAHAAHNPVKPSVWQKMKGALGLKNEDISYEEFVTLVCESLADYELDKYMSDELAMKIKHKYLK